jgi:large conductance mechanosensitive channel
MVVIITLDAAKGGTAVITYGNLLQATINFVLHCLFLILRAAEKMKRIDCSGCNT